MSYILSFLMWLSPDPTESSRIAANSLGAPWLARILIATCHRETRCTAKGVHAQDAWAGRSMHRNAVRVGWLQPETCEHHRREAVDSWAVSGPWGASRAYTLRHLEQPCVPAAWLDVPLIGAYAVAQRMLAVCKGRSTGCSKEVRIAWRGRGNVRRAESELQVPPPRPMDEL